MIVGSIHQSETISQTQVTKLNNTFFLTVTCHDNTSSLKQPPGFAGFYDFGISNGYRDHESFHDYSKNDSLF